MKKTSFLLILILAGIVGAYGQETKPDEPQDTPVQPVQRDDRMSTLREIGLTPVQIREIRRLNMERKPQMEAAQTRLREANRLLDEAIYADQVNEADVQARLKEAQSAQAEVFRIRSMSEFAIRRILTPDQLVHFRELRQRFEAAREDNRKRRQEMQQNGMRPDRRFPNNGGARPFVQQPKRQQPPQQKQP